MSAIRKLIKRAVGWSPEVDALITAAEAELRELELSLDLLKVPLEAAKLELAERDRADAELLKAWRRYDQAPGDEAAEGAEYDRTRREALIALRLWAAAKGGGK